jgi:hypothetical protein
VSTYEGSSTDETPWSCESSSTDEAARAYEGSSEAITIAGSPESVNPNAVGVIVTSSPRIARIRRCVYWGRWRGIISRAHAYANSDSDPLRVGGTGAEEHSHKHESAC